MRNPCLTSAIIPAYNAERYLAAAIESVLAQDCQSVEAIVVDDGSTDTSGEIARSYPSVRYIRQANLGVSSARNAGIAVAQGAFLAFLDADDIWMPNKCRVQLAYMLQHPDVGFSFTWQRFVFEPGIVAPQWFPRHLLEQDHVAYIPSTLMVRRATFDGVGGFDITLNRGEDTEWLLRAKDRGVPMGIVQEALLLRRVHGGNVSLMRSPDYGLLLSLLQQSIDRRRRV